MMYYIDMPQTYKPANRKCAEIQEYIERFNHCLIASDLSRDALIEEIRHKVDELNKAYPRTKKLVVNGISHIMCYPEGKACEYQYVFLFDFKQVMSTYQFSEKGNVLKSMNDDRLPF